MKATPVSETDSLIVRQQRKSVTDDDKKIARSN